MHSDRKTWESLQTVRMSEENYDILRGEVVTSVFDPEHEVAKEKLCRNELSTFPETSKPFPSSLRL